MPCLRFAGPFAALWLLGSGPAFADHGPGQHGALASYREAHAARKELKALERAVASSPGNSDTTALLRHAREAYRTKRTAFWRSVQRTPAVQMVKGIVVDGPRDTWDHIKKHPLKAVAIVAGAAIITTTAGSFGVPVDLIALAASGALTLKAVVGKLGEVRQAFRRHSPKRWRLFGEDVLYPEIAFGAGLGASAVAEAGVEALEASVPSLQAPALAVGAKSTTQLLDDLVPVSSALDDGKPQQRHHSWWRRLLGSKARHTSTAR